MPFLEHLKDFRTKKNQPKWDLNSKDGWISNDTRCECSQLSEVILSFVSRITDLAVTVASAGVPSRPNVIHEWLWVGCHDGFCEPGYQMGTCLSVVYIPLPVTAGKY